MLKRILKKVKRLEYTSQNKINSLFVGNYCSVFQGRGIEFADIRPYDLNDDIRDIDWKTTAKQGKVFVKKYQESRDNTLFFILDFSPAIYFQSSETGKFENMLETFAMLSFSAIKNGDRVGVIFSDLKERKVFLPKRGRNHIFKILTEAIKIYEKKEFDFLGEEKSEEDLDFILKILKYSSVVFYFAGHLPDFKKRKSFFKKVKKIKMKHDFVPVIFSDQMERDLKIRGEIDLQDSFSGKNETFLITDMVAEQYNKKYQKKKESFLSQLRKYRIETIFIDNSETIFKELFNFFKKRQKHLI